MPISPGDKLGPYEIIAPIGAGGMGEVWKARDIRLDRIVAIKRIKTEHLERFRREARAIAALNHPHICQIYDVGPDYLVMENVEGAPLKSPLPAEEAVRLAIQVASALEEAHSKGIIHRDLKPANILITPKGEAKLLDFGLAKLKEQNPPDDVSSTLTGGLTEVGVVVGTVAYMSPEQAQGKSIDARSDIFSFGLVLYEALTGRRAFGGDNALAIMSAIVRDEPSRMQTSEVLERIVKRCLAKQASERYQTMGEVRSALAEVIHSRHLDQPLHQPVLPSIAVLPFANMSGDKEYEYFSDGLAEEILNALANVPGLRVIARTSAFAFKGQNADIRRIAYTLGVANILDGSVRKAGNRIRVSAQLITAADGGHLWSERYDREMADIFAIQDEISHAITSALRMKLSVGLAPVKHYTPDILAWEAYLKGRYHLVQRTRTPESLARCKECLEKAIALDPQFALPHSELGRYYENLAVGGLLPARESLSLARASAQRALDLNPSLPQGHAVLGVVAAALDYDWSEAERQFRLATGHDPVPPEVRSDYAMFYLLPRGQVREAVTESERALKEDPLNMIARTMVAVGLASDERASENHYRQILELDGNFTPALFGLGLNLASRGLLAEALPLAERAHSQWPRNMQVMGLLSGVLARMGEASRVEGLVARLEPGFAYGAPRGLAIFHLLCSETAKAAYWVERAIEQRDPFLVVLIRHPIFEPLRSSPHWSGLAGMMQLPEASSP